MSVNKGMLAGGPDEWETPPRLFQFLDRMFGFQLDVAATDENRLCRLWYTKERSGLEQPWAPHVTWLNPPYGRSIGKWLQKALDESRAGATVVALIPARVDTQWWHRIVLEADEVWFLEGRVPFSGQQGAPFPSAIAVFREHPPRPKYQTLQVKAVLDCP